MRSNQLIKVTKIIGSQQKLAKELGLSAKTVNHWLNKEIRVPVQYALAIEMIVNGKIVAEEIAPHAKIQILSFKSYLLDK